jgi:hypothetical protein
MENFSVDVLFDESAAATEEFIDVEDLEHFTRYKTRSIWYLVAKWDKKIEQISFLKGSNIKYEGSIGVGDSLNKVFELIGKCKNSGRIYYPLDVDGVLFEIENKKKSRSIESFTIFRPEKFLGNLPDHIADNLKHKKRKLP